MAKSLSSLSSLLCQNIYLTTYYFDGLVCCCIIHTSVGSKQHYLVPGIPGQKEYIPMRTLGRRVVQWLVNLFLQQTPAINATRRVRV